MPERRHTQTVTIGSLSLGSAHPIVIQSMTNTPTTDVDATLKQTIELIKAGCEMVRWTVNNDQAALAASEIIKTLRAKGYHVPIIGDFHFNGHLLLHKYPRLARDLDKYRINPGNVGKGEHHDQNFTTMIKTAVDLGKAVRIGANSGSLDQELLRSLMKQNAKKDTPQTSNDVIKEAMIQSVLNSAQSALALGLKKEQLVLSVKMSDLQDTVDVYTRLAEQCDYVLHLGLTEAGGDIQGITASAAALGIMLQQRIGDTIRVSLTPQPGTPRAREVEVCKSLLQALGLRYFQPQVTSCPGCGRTDSTLFQELAADVRDYIKENIPKWKERYPGVERLKIAVMGCVVNGPGESKHADIGISLPGKNEEPRAPVFVEGEKVSVLEGANLKTDFLNILQAYIEKRFSATQ